MFENLISFLYFSLTLIFLIFPSDMREGAKVGLLSGGRVAVFSLFPLMVMSRLLASSKPVLSLTKRLSKTKLFTRLSISPSLLPVVLSGLISGLPGSASVIGKMVSEKKISKKEGEKALALSSLPSPVFVLSVAFDNTLYSMLFYLFLLVLNYNIATLFKSEKSVGEQVLEKCDLSSALRSSCSGVLNVISSVVFFTSLTFSLSHLFPFLKTPLSLVLELTRACVLFRENLHLSSFAVGFAGISALFQIKSGAPNLSIRPYLITRLISSLFLFLFSFYPLLSPVIFMLSFKITTYFLKALEKKRFRNYNIMNRYKGERL